MIACVSTPRLRATGLAVAVALFGLLLSLDGCKKAAPKAESQLEQAGMYFDHIQELHNLKMSPDEVGQLAKARQAGLTDQDCIDLMNQARRRQIPFDEGDAIAGLMGAGASEQTVMVLAHLNQLGAFAGEAQVMRLAGLSDDVILALARRHSAGQPVLSGAKAADLRNVQLTNAQILHLIGLGYTDAQADAMIAQRTRAAGGHSFVRQRGTRHPR
jgi:hypothetical protein